MENNDIMNMIIRELNDGNIWFTTEQDPTFQDVDFYYELDEYGDPTEKTIDKIAKEVTDLVGDGAADINDAIKMWIEENLIKCTISYKEVLKTVFKDKPVVDQIEAYINPVQLKTESVKARLKEENNKSLNLISAKLTDKDFDSESKDGQIVLRTSELFNVLSSAGYDVDVAFDNGESQSTILLSNQGGNVIITITELNTPLRAFASGNFEITDEALEIMSDIQEQIKSI